ncbi:hypothetical protein ASF70_15800 [Rhizobium sp. Leaf321]|uniref:phage minor head protein n=1 Tax=Rhizobium sp. Leaf321 TaxID=1736335 RepID=UPI00071536A3|nr:phage minor head protein [Rhizobium sp. Leaf321]KQQ72934.1 hypothetical protein ASF70_15800 [Rhizobium sp. Leaf321]
MIGLTPDMARTVMRARNGLIQADKAEIARYLGYNLRDKRYDAVARRAAAEGWDAALAAYNKGRKEPLKKAQLIGRIVASYKDRALKYRARLIAENETITAMRAGRHEGFRQLVDGGTVSEDQIERSWDSAEDKKTRPDHLAMEGQKVEGLSTPFVAPDGSLLMFPGDRSLGATTKQTIRCRCFERVRIRYIR